MLVIESLDHAVARGADILGGLVEYGTSADAYHLIASPEDGKTVGVRYKKRLRMQASNPEQTQHLNAHAASHRWVTKGDLAAVKAVFGENSTIAVASTKSATGHLLGGCW